MTVYLDSSVVLRVLLGEEASLRQWADLEETIMSELTRVECLRSLDRYTLLNRLDPASLAAHRGALLNMLDRPAEVAVTRSILKRASDPFPTPLGTLDAIHLATAIALRDGERLAVRFATHDRQLGIAAVSMGFNVLGIGERDV